MRNEHNSISVFHNWLAIFWVFVFQLFTFSVLAENTIQPDRPGFGTGTYTIAPGELYIELGYQHSFSSLSGTPGLHQMPQTNIRYGITPKFEMNLGWEGLEASKGVNSYSSLGIGAKLRLVQSDDYNISLLGGLGFSDIATDIAFSPMLGLLWDYEISSSLEAFGVVQLGYESGQDIFTEFSLGLAIPLGDKAGLYGEYYIEFTPRQSDLSHNADIGITYLITNNIQIDAYFATELTTNAFRHIGVGFATRF